MPFIHICWLAAAIIMGSLYVATHAAMYIILSVQNNNRNIKTTNHAIYIFQTKIIICVRRGVVWYGDGRADYGGDDYTPMMMGCVCVCVCALFLVYSKCVCKYGLYDDCYVWRHDGWLFYTFTKNLLTTTHGCIYLYVYIYIYVY